VKGVVDVVQIPRGVAVVADSTWNAIQGRNAPEGRMGRQQGREARHAGNHGRV
jgi:hypothetical protein